MKRVWFSYTGTVILISILSAVLFWLLQPFFKKNNVTLSPLPSFLTSFNNSYVTTLNIWVPDMESIRKTQTQSVINPSLSAKSALVYDLTTNLALFAKNPNEKLPMASLTKIMTAIIALENKRSDDQYKVVQTDLVGENSMGLTSIPFF